LLCAAIEASDFDGLGPDILANMTLARMGRTRGMSD